jgi:hypothetical protein
MSGPWLRALAAGLPTITMDLAHTADVATLDPRTWAVRAGSGIRGPGSVTEDAATGKSDAASRTPPFDSAPAGPEALEGLRPVSVAIDILDEDHSLRLAMRRLATDTALRESLGANARAYWDSEHSMPRMLEDYRHVIAEAASMPVPRPPLPAHLIDNGDATLRALLAPFGIESDTVFLG